MVRKYLVSAVVSGIFLFNVTSLQHEQILEPAIPVEVVAEILAEVEPVVEVERVERVEKTSRAEFDTKLLGEFRITQYCACAVCCGKYAKRRPKDESGNPIVYGASGERLIPGVSCAAPRNIPFGTALWVDGKRYIVMDRTAAWVEKKLGPTVDIYTGYTEEAHKEADRFGLDHAEVREEIHYAQSDNG